MILCTPALAKGTWPKLARDGLAQTRPLGINWPHHGRSVEVDPNAPQVALGEVRRPGWQPILCRCRYRRVGVAISANPRRFGKSGPIDTGKPPIRSPRRHIAGSPPSQVMYHAVWPPRPPVHPRRAAMRAAICPYSSCCSPAAAAPPWSTKSSGISCCNW